jgi:hypothetical protein
VAVPIVRATPETTPKMAFVVLRMASLLWFFDKTLLPLLPDSKSPSHGRT